eukprot:Hpha_TRINITY_DN16315_c0_g4::TRINITY_DN16315_c0_g4_i1::g.59125::m.59125
MVRVWVTVADGIVKVCVWLRVAEGRVMVDEAVEELEGSVTVASAEPVAEGRDNDVVIVSEGTVSEVVDDGVTVGIVALRDTVAVVVCSTVTVGSVRVVVVLMVSVVDSVVVLVSVSVASFDSDTVPDKEELTVWEADLSVIVSVRLALGSVIDCVCVAEPSTLHARAISNMPHSNAPIPFVCKGGEGGGRRCNK